MRPYHLPGVHTPPCISRTAPASSFKYEEQRQQASFDKSLDIRTDDSDHVAAFDRSNPCVKFVRRTFKLHDPLYVNI